MKKNHRRSALGWRVVFFWWEWGTVMYYDNSNARFVSEDGLYGFYTIHADESLFVGAKIVVLNHFIPKFSDDDEYVKIEICRIDEIIEGLRMAKDKALGLTPL